MKAKSEFNLNQKQKAKRQSEMIDVANEYRRPLLDWISRKVRDEEEAEDVAQEVIEDFLETYEVGTVIEQVSAWLYRVAQNKIIDRFRKKKHETAYQDSLRLEPEPEAEEEWARSWLREELAEAIALLPEEQRHVFLMHEIEGKSFEEIAKETGISVNTLLSRKRYAILFLREHLKEVYDELE